MAFNRRTSRVRSYLEYAENAIYVRVMTAEIMSNNEDERTFLYSPNVTTHCILPVFDGMLVNFPKIMLRFS